jgi:hypothetical protein
VYSLGGGCSADVVFGAGNASTGASNQTLLLSSDSGVPYWSGVQQVLAGVFPDVDQWNGGWQGVPVTLVHAGESWLQQWTVGVNSFDFPVTTLDASAVPPAGFGPMADEDLRALLTGIYASPVGALTTYDAALPGQIATTIHRPDTGYANTFNYFDPDSYFSLSAMLFSGEVYLQEQCRAVIERSGDFLLASGQLPHHFVGNWPVYTALSGATQTGPNLFWTLTALQYAKVTQDGVSWLQSYMPKLRQSVGFLLHFFDDKASMLSVPGSLMIDVFIRQNYASDSNAMIVRGVAVWCTVLCCVVAPVLLCCAVPL